MYNNYPVYNNQMYQQDLQTMRDRIDKQLQQINQPQNQQAPITQNFQLAPTQGNNGIKYVNTIDDVRKELVLGETLFVNKEYSFLWYKNASGEIKTYELKEIIELDEKDRQIEFLMAKINKLEKEIDSNAKYVDANVDGATSSKKSPNVSNDKSGKK